MGTVVCPEESSLESKPSMNGSKKITILPRFKMTLVVLTY